MNTKSEKQSTVGSESTSRSESPKRWWQWFLVYPGLAIAIIGAIPTYMEAFKSYRLGVPFGRSVDAQDQNRLWQDNFECTQKASFFTITNKKKVEIGSVVCDTGDILLRGKRPEWERPQLRWVSWNEVAPSDKIANNTNLILGIVKSAYAGESDRLVLAQGPAAVLCQRWIAPGQLLQRISTPMGCYDQVINTFSGWVVSSHPAPCAPYC